MNVLSLKLVLVQLNKSNTITHIIYESKEGASKKVGVIAYKLLINQNGNHNKFYELYRVEDGTQVFTIVKYGRIGRNPTQYMYFDSNSYDKKYSEKLSKGYREVGLITYRKDYRNI